MNPQAKTGIVLARSASDLPRFAPISPRFLRSRPSWASCPLRCAGLLRWVLFWVLFVGAVTARSAVEAQVATGAHSSTEVESYGTSRRVRLLTLDEAIELAHAANPAYERAVNNLELNEVEGREFWLDFLPRPRVTLLQTSMRWNRSTIGTDNFGNPVPNPELRMIQSARSDQFASLTWELDLGDLHRWRSTRLRGEEREVEVDRASNELASEVRTAFLDAQELLESSRIAERLEGMRRVIRELAERRFRLAQVDRPDLLAARLDHAEQQLESAEIRTRLEAALLRLRSVIGDADLEEFVLSPTPLRIFDPTRIDPGVLVADAVESGPEMRAARIGLELAERNVSLRRAAWLPTLSVDATTGRRELSRESGGAFFRPVPDGEWDRTVGFTLAFPDLGRFFRRGAAARRDEVEVRSARSSLREIRLRVGDEVRRLAGELRSRYRLLGVQEGRVELARERLGLQQERYRLGQIDYLRLQSSVEAAADAERSALEARYAFERALLDLERARGMPLTVADGP